MSADVIATLPAAPGWAASAEVHDHGRRFSASFGTLVPADDRTVHVELVQNENLDYHAQPAVVRREAPQVRIGCYRIDLDQAAELARAIQAALGVATGPSGAGDGR